LVKAKILPSPCLVQKLLAHLAAVIDREREKMTTRELESYGNWLLVIGLPGLMTAVLIPAVT
jgi:hypothetical protein